jgi:hypothetical protein
MSKPLQNMDNDKIKMAMIILRSIYTEYKTAGPGSNLATLREATKTMTKLEDFEEVMNFLFDNRYIRIDSATNVYILTQLGIKAVESEGR